jgi:DnaJ family protein C protein 3
MGNNKKATPFCDEALTANENSLYGLLNKAKAHMEAENFDAAIGSLNKAKEHHPGAQQVQQLLQKAHVELKRSKTKDYYKVLGLTRDADELQIKGAYRKMVKINHPDKAHKQGITKEDAERKMAQINEAYEVLSDPELKQRYDQGDDPNDHEQQRGNPFQQGGNPFQGFGGGNPFGGQSGGGGQQFKFQFGGGGGGFPFG